MLETTRLKLVPLTHEQMVLYKNNPQGLAEDLGVKYEPRQNDPSVAQDLEEAIGFWIMNTDVYRSSFKWYTNWEIIVKDEHIAIGGIGFTGPPNEEGRSMVGYGLDIRYHGKGYATEALQAMVAWGFSHESLKAITADTPLMNIPSHRVLEKNSFEEVNRDESLIHWQLIK